MFDGLYRDVETWLKKPFNSDLSIGSLLLVFVLFLIVAFIVNDSMRILKAWMDAAADTAMDAIT